MKFLNVFVLIFSSYFLFSQNFKSIPVDDKVYKNNIKTVRIHPETWEIGYPVLKLESGNHLLFSFDQIESQPADYYYTIIHCTRHWAFSDISYFDYAEGFVENEITSWEDSRNTMVQYTHYKLTIPNNDVKLKISGNYLLIVYLKDGSELVPVVTRRFMVYEPILEIQAKVNVAPQSAYRSNFQKVDFTIDKRAYNIDDPYRELKVVIMQNYQWNNIITDIQPTFLNNQYLIYEYEDKITFNAGNEYRYFNFNNLELASENIEFIEFRNPYYYIELKKDKNKMFDPYSSVEDINGSYIIKTNRFGQKFLPEIEAEYAIVNFKLEMPNPLSASDVYLYGALTGWEISDSYKMKYNLENRCYETMLLLKQGYYNYRYLTLKNNEKNGFDHAFLEGSHKQTENDYLIFVYHKSVSDNYDKLIGFTIVNSVRK